MLNNLLSIENIANIENLNTMEKLEIILKGFLKFILLNGINLIIGLIVLFTILVVITKITRNKFWLKMLIEKYL